MYDWYAASEMGRLTVEERVAWAERQHRINTIRADKPSLFSRLTALIGREDASDQKQSGFSDKPATPRGI